MPKLPERQNERDFELMDKPAWNRGTFAENKAKSTFGINTFKFPKKFLLLLIVLAVISVGAYLGLKKFLPLIDDQKSQVSPSAAQKIEYPFDVASVQFTSEMARKTFLDNFQKASLEKDSKAKYKLLEANFLTLKGLYISTQSSQYRVNLEKFKTYMEKYFPKEVSQDPAVYNVSCLDLLCGTPAYPDEINAIKAEVDVNSSIAENAKVDISQNFKAAALTDNKAQQANYYMNALSALFSEYTRAKDEKTKATHQKLHDFITVGYEEFAIPKEISF